MDDDEWLKKRTRARRENRDERRSQQARDRVDIGRWFQMGMAAMRGETAQNGWRTEHFERSLGRRYDTARVVDPTDRRFTEYKSGRTPTRETLKQLGKDRQALERGWSGTWVRVADVHFSGKVEEKLRELQRDFRDRFDLVTVTEQQRRAAIDRGRELELGGQLSLFDAGKLQEHERERAKNARDRREREVRAARAQQREREQRERDHGREPERDAWRGKPWRVPERERAREEREPPPATDLRTVVELHALSFPQPPNAPVPREMERERAEREALARHRYRERDPRGRDARRRDHRERER